MKVEVPKSANCKMASRELTVGKCWPGIWTAVGKFAAGTVEAAAVEAALVVVVGCSSCTTSSSKTQADLGSKRLINI